MAKSLRKSKGNPLHFPFMGPVCKILMSSIATVFLWSAECAFSQYIDIIAPGSAAGVEGNSSAVPLNTGGPERFQQVYGSSVFGDFSQGVSIGQIAFRVDAFQGRSFSATVTNIELHLSTTPKQPGGLSSIFDQNVGSDDKTVIGRAPFQLSGAGGGGVFGPWSIVFDLRSNPFPYNPNAGNLLLDLKVFTGAGTTYFDAVDRSDEVSSVFGFGTSIPNSGQASSLGLATFFAVQPIPEPSTMALLVLGMAGFGLVGLKENRAKGQISVSLMDSLVVLDPYPTAQCQIMRGGRAPTSK